MFAEAFFQLFLACMKSWELQHESFMKGHVDVVIWESNEDVFMESARPSNP
jgi:hypothetical protein